MSTGPLSSSAPNSNMASIDRIISHPHDIIKYSDSDYLAALLYHLLCFNILSCDLNILSHSLNISIYGHIILSHDLNILSRELDLLSCGFQIIS